MKILVIGCGSIGKRHIQNIKLFDNSQISAFDISSSRLEEVKQKYGISIYSDFKKALGSKPDAVLICTPNSLHMESAIPAAEAGCHLFVEKPISHNLEKVNELIKLVKKNKLHFLMGSNWKFHPSFKLMKSIIDDNTIGRIISFTVISGQYLPDWHPWEDYRKGYSANKSLGGGILLDSHELDCLQWFLGHIKKLSCFSGKYSNLEINTEDIAEVTVQLENRAVGNIHLDYIQHPYRKTYLFYGEKGTLEWSYREKKVSLYLADKKEWQYFPEDNNYDINQMYIEEMKHLFKVLQGKEMPITDIYKAKQILKVIESAKKASSLRKIITL